MHELIENPKTTPKICPKPIQPIKNKQHVLALLLMSRQHHKKLVQLLHKQCSLIDTCVVLKSVFLSICVSPCLKLNSILSKPNQLSNYT